MYGVRQFPVENDDALDTALEHRVHAGLDLRNYAAGDHTLGDEAGNIADLQLLNDLLVLVEHARHVGEEDEALGVKRAGDRAGEGVGVDIIAFAARTFRDAASTGMSSRPST